jgi:cyclic-di-GMP-binding protein
MNHAGEEVGMPSFDIVSEVDMHEVNNAIDQANREVGTRFDFKGIDAKFEVTEQSDILVAAEVDFQVRQMLEILRGKLVKRGVDIKSLVEGEVETTLQKATMNVKIQQGIESEIARKIVKMVKATKIKVQTAIQGEKLRVSGKKRDDLQKVMSMLKDASLGIPLQYDNFRD